MTAERVPYDELVIEIDMMTGERHLIGDPPPVVVWAAELIIMLQLEDGHWARIENTPDGAVIVLDVQPGPVRYRLTGEREFDGLGVVAELIP